MRKSGKMLATKIGSLVRSLELVGTLIQKEASARGIDPWLINRGEVTLRPNSNGGIAAFYADVRFKPNFGLNFVLRSLSTCEDGGSPVEPQKLASEYVDVMEALKASAAQIHARRMEIRVTALSMLAEAAAEGIPMELMSIEPDWVMVGGGMPVATDMIAFDVTLLLLHFEDGQLVPDAFTVPIMDADDIVQHLLHNTLPNQRQLRAEMAEEWDRVAAPTATTTSGQAR